MNDTRIKSSFLLALFVSFCILQNVQVFAIHEPYDVIIASGLPNTSPLLRIHCASKDNNLGFHDLRPNEQFTWHFRMNYWWTTKFFCHFWWGSKDTAFDVMSFSFARHHCGVEKSGNKCYWLVKEDGFYFAKSGMAIPGYLEKLRDWPQ